MGAPIVGEVDGEYHYDSKKHVLDWNLPVINANNKNGSLEFSIAGFPGDFFPVKVSFISTKSYCNVEVCGLMIYCENVCILSEQMLLSIEWVCTLVCILVEP